MALPETLAQLAALLLLVVPGIVFTAGRRFFRGPTPDEKDFSVRLVHAICASVVFDCVYVLAAGPWLIEKINLYVSADKVLAGEPREAAFALLVFAVLIPLAVGGLAQVRFRKWGLYWKDRRYGNPSAWDEAAPQRADCYVKIFTEDQTWIGGYIPHGQAYVSTYPEPRDIFIPEQWKMSKSGEFLYALQDTFGMYIPLSGKERVFWSVDRTEAPSE